MSFSFYITEFSKDNLLYFALPLFFMAILIELYVSYSNRLNLYEKKDSITSFWMLVFSAIVEFIPKLLFFILFYRIYELSPFKDRITHQWWAWIALFLLDDFLYYWFHRLNHEIRLFWAGHVTHHSATKMNFGTALRQGVGERLHKYIFWIPLPFLGFHPLMIFMMMSISLIYRIFFLE